MTTRAAGAREARIDLRVRIGALDLANPVMPASGCFGPELGPLLPRPHPGALVTKTVFAEERGGNAAPRLAETAFGMLNSVGIPSPGSRRFTTRVLPRYLALSLPVVVSIGGLYTADYYTIARVVADQPAAAIEINVSCPNLEHGGLAIGTSPDHVAEVVAGVRGLVRQPVTVKLTPTISSIAEVALAAESAGADGLVVANSFSGLAIDLDTRRPALGNGAGGYTGPAVKPLALKLVRDAAAAVSIPVIGCGGITTAADVAEFLIAGATAVQVGTATFTRPRAISDIVAGLPAVCRRLGVERVVDLIGTIRDPAREAAGPPPETPSQGPRPAAGPASAARPSMEETR